MKFRFTSFIALVLCPGLLCLSACGVTKTPDDNLQKESASATVCATVTEIKKYGHAVLDITTADLTTSGFAFGDAVRVRVGEFALDMPYFDGYYADPGELMLRGDAPEDAITVCINYDSFAQAYGVTVGDAVEISLVEKAAVLMVQEICSLQYTNDPADYADDATFANFRAVTVGRIGEGKLYRSASAVNNDYGRAAYADKLIKSVGVATVLNLSDSEEDILESFGADDFDSAYYRSLYDAGRVTAIDLDADFRSQEFASAIADGLTFLAKGEAPYHIHCKEGKDRAGFVAMLLEALMGASVDEIIDDYMLSFYNYYGITKEHEPARYRAVLDKNLLPMMYHVTGAADRAALAKTDLKAAVTDYLLAAGMAQADIAALQEKLA